MSMFKLGELADLTVGFVGSMAAHYSESGVPFLRSLNIRPHRIDPAGLMFIDAGFEEKIKKSRLREGDVVVVRTGSPGVSAVIPAELDGANCSDLVIIRPGSGLNSRWLSYWINNISHTISKNHSVGAVQQHFNVKTAANLPITAPALAEQDAIAEVLGTLDNKIAANRAVVRVADALASTRFRQVSVDCAREPLGSIAALILGGTPNRAVEEYWGGSVPWIASGACNQRIITSPTEHITELGLRESAAKMLPPKTTVVAITGATLGQMGWLGSAMSANQSVVGVVSASMPTWIHYALRSERTQLMNWATGGAQQHVNKGAVGAVTVPYDEVRSLEFERTIAPLMDRAVAAEQENTTLAATRDELLPLLMSGRITVKDAEKRVEEEV